jgi:hypothetical protein
MSLVGHGSSPRNPVGCTAVNDADPPESTFQERLSRAVGNYIDRQGSDGGWGEDRFDGAPSSIVNTVEVLAVLRAGGVRYDDTAVKRALIYLRSAVVSHPLPEPSDNLVGPPRIAPTAESDEARGEFVRYCAWGISGLTLYKESRHDETLAEAQSHCVKWLYDRMWTNMGPLYQVPEDKRMDIKKVGAWGETPHDEHPSLLSTSAAIAGLSRMCSRHQAGAVAIRLVRAARNVILSLAQKAEGPHPMVFWPGRREDACGEGSASVTAMAVISLAGGNENDRRYAGEGARWLLSRKDTWNGQVEADDVPDANWQHMTFSLALRAILRGAQLPSSDPTLSPVVGHLSALWCHEHNEWAHGMPDLRPSPSGSYAVVAAYEAMAKAWPFDAQRQILEATSAARRSDKPAPLHVHVDESSLTVISRDRSKVTVPLPPRFAAMMNLVARNGVGDGDLDSRSFGVRDLEQQLDVEAETIKHYTREINNILKEETLKAGKPIGDIVQVTNDTRRKEKRVRINVERVTVGELLPAGADA